MRHVEGEFPLSGNLARTLKAHLTIRTGTHRLPSMRQRRAVGFIGTLR